MEWEEDNEADINFLQAYDNAWQFSAVNNMSVTTRQTFVSS
jgi:hypothetical protein